MAQSKESYGKKDKEKARLKKRRDKEQKKEERRTNPQGGGLDNMMAYVDEYGNITDTPSDPLKKMNVSADSIELGVPKRAKEDVISERKGRVEFFNDSKGFGFIVEQGTNAKYFVHVSGCEDEIKENDMVIFELQRGLKGMNAFKVKKVKKQ